MLLVIDASIVLAWCFPEENDPVADRALDAVSAGAGLVPPHWHAEIANTLLVAKRRRRLTEPEIARFLDGLMRLRIQVDEAPLVRAWMEASALAEQEKLTVYDAMYLDLAIRRSLPLATLDRELARAAARHALLYR
jgi:predicted nucleic acid-binding protein